MENLQAAVNFIKERNFTRFMDSIKNTLNNKKMTILNSMFEDADDNIRGIHTINHYKMVDDHVGNLDIVDYPVPQETNFEYGDDDEYESHDDPKKTEIELIKRRLKDLE